MQIGILCEGTIDFELVSALAQRIARTRAGVSWPLRISDTFSQLMVRRGGYGQIPKCLKRLLPLIQGGDGGECQIFMVVVDQIKREAIRRITRIIRNNHRFILGIAIREIEAWWLADRENTLRWLGLRGPADPAGRYWRPGYNPERDDDPKRTLDELTTLSQRVDRRYGEGNTDLAREFAAIWSERAILRDIETGCPRGFAPFCKTAAQRLRSERRPHARQ